MERHVGVFRSSPCAPVFTATSVPTQILPQKAWKVFFVLKMSCGVHSVDLMAGTQAVKTLWQVLRKKVCFLGCPYGLVCRLDLLSELWTCSRCSAMCAFTPKRDPAPLQATQSVTFTSTQVNSSTIVNRYLVPLLTSLTHFCSVHIYGDWQSDTANGAIIYIHVLHWINTDTQVAFP